MFNENESESSSPIESYPPRQGGRIAAVGVVLALCIGLLAYAVHERGEVSRITAQNQQINAALADTKGQIESLSSKLNDLTAAEQARQQAQARTQAEAARRNVRGTVQRRRADDARWKKVQSELDANKQAIDATRNDLTQAKTDLGSSIARTHDELVVLQRKGERNYYEFDINKSKQFSRVGPVAIALRKANEKKQFADLHLNVDDADLEKKHVNLFEPVTFLNADSGQPVQVVINRISKNHIHGYVAEPKYRGSEVASTAGAADSAAATGTAASAPPAARKKLTIPQQ